MIVNWCYSPDLKTKTKRRIKMDNAQNLGRNLKNFLGAFYDSLTGKSAESTRHGRTERPIAHAYGGSSPSDSSYNAEGLDELIEPGLIEAYGTSQNYDVLEKQPPLIWGYGLEKTYDVREDGSVYVSTESGAKGLVVSTLENGVLSISDDRGTDLYFSSPESRTGRIGSTDMRSGGSYMLFDFLNEVGFLDQDVTVCADAEEAGITLTNLLNKERHYTSLKTKWLTEAFFEEPY